MRTSLCLILGAALALTRVGWTAQAAQAPEVVFPATRVGAESRLTLQLQNDTPRTLTLQVPQAREPFRVLSGRGRHRLRPGAHAALVLRFRPRSVGETRQILVVRSLPTRIMERSYRLVGFGTGADPPEPVPPEPVPPQPVPPQPPIPEPPQPPEPPTPVPPTDGLARYVAPEGRATNAGTLTAPWPLAEALDGSLPVPPGATLWIAAGTYRAPGQGANVGFHLLLKGEAGKPIQVKPRPGAWVILDGGIWVQAGTRHVHLWDLAVIVSDPRPSAPLPPPERPARPWGGINLFNCEDVRLIHCTVRDGNQGISWWQSARGGEVYGCYVYRNGWQGTDRGHGHALYTQNEGTLKRIENNLMWEGYGYSLHAYGEGAPVSDYHIEQNASWNNGGQFLVGGQRPSRNITVLGNVCYDDSLQVGYSARDSLDATVQDNVTFEAPISITGFARVTESGNRSYLNTPNPFAPEAHLWPSKYDPARAHLVIVKKGGAATTTVDLSRWLKEGERVSAYDPARLNEAAVASGGRLLSLPVRDGVTAYVLRKAP